MSIPQLFFDVIVFLVIRILLQDIPTANRYMTIIDNRIRCMLNWIHQRLVRAPKVSVERKDEEEREQDSQKTNSKITALRKKVNVQHEAFPSNESLKEPVPMGVVDHVLEQAALWYEKGTELPWNDPTNKNDLYYLPSGRCIVADSTPKGGIKAPKGILDNMAVDILRNLDQPKGTTRSKDLSDHLQR